MDTSLIKGILKNKKLLSLIILFLIFFIIALGSCSNIQKKKRLIQKEISQRMNLEQRLANFEGEKQKLENNLLVCQKELQELKQELETTKAALSQEQLTNSSLKKELDKVNRLKEALEEDLQQGPPEVSTQEKMK